MYNSSRKVGRETFLNFYEKFLIFNVIPGDRLNLRSGWGGGPCQAKESECGARLLQHGHRQGRCHQPRGRGEYSSV